MDNQVSNVSKPVTVARAEFVSNLTDLINGSELPAFIIEPILKDFLSDVRAIAQRQLEQDTIRYQQALENIEKNSQK